MRISGGIAATLVAALSLAACTSSPHAPQSDRPAATSTTSSSSRASACADVQCRQGLFDTDWLVASVQPSAGITPPFDAGLIIRRDGTFQAGVDPCEALLGTISFTARSATFESRVWGHSCPSGVHVNQRTATLLEQVLTGDVDWSVTANTLTLTKTRVGTVTYKRGPVDPPSPSN